MKALQFRRRAPGLSWFVVLVWWTMARGLTWLFFRLVYRVRLHGAEHVPESGPLIFASNHQSNYDPTLVGLVIWDRPFSPMAREGLFRFKPFAWLIQRFGSISLQREGSDLSAMRMALKELQAGRCVLIFPEGSRTADGTLGAFHRGVLLLARRSGATVVPAAVEGALDVWPRGRRLPRLRGRLAAKAGPPIPPDTLLGDGDEPGLECLRRTIETLRLELRSELRRVTGQRWLRPGPGDQPYWERQETTPEDDQTQTRVPDAGRPRTPDQS